MMTLQRNRQLLAELRLCLIAGNEVYLTSREPKLLVTYIVRTFDKTGQREKGTVIKVKCDDKWITLLSGETLQTIGTYGREWTV